MFSWPKLRLQTIDRTESVESVTVSAISLETESAPIPVLAPQMPPATELAKHLLDQEETKAHANGGPLSRKLSGQLSRHLGCAEDTLVTVSSGTAGLTAALLALDLPENAVCLMPSWTAAATAHAAVAARLKPWFLDVDRRTWALNAQAAKQMIEQTGCPARALIVVAPFGAPIDIRSWEAFQAETGISVIVDAASGFDTVSATSLISVVSLNANKVLSAGEGGFVIAPNVEMRDRIQARSNHAVNSAKPGERQTSNSPMSEFQAATALANLDRWPETRLKHLQVTGWYRNAFSHMPQVCLQPGYGAGWVSGLTNILLESDSAESISRFMLRENGIETKLWWSTGCHAQPAFANFPRMEMSKTKYLASRVLGLPHYPDMQRADVTRVVSALSKALASRARGRRRG